MSIPSFTQGYPPDGSSLGETKSTVRDNLDGTFQTLAVDHIDNNGSPGSKPAGYHKVIHMVPQGSNPGAVSGYGQLFSKTVNSFTNSQALFWETGSGLIQQLTVNLTPSAGNNGYTFLAGGLILQWGIATAVTSGSFSSGTAEGTVTFATSNVAFPTNCFMVLATTRNGSSPTGSRYAGITITAKSATTFTWSCNGSSSAANGFYWMAIGN